MTGAIRERSFFGVMRVANTPDPRLGGDGPCADARHDPARRPGARPALRLHADPLLRARHADRAGGRRRCRRASPARDRRGGPGLGRRGGLQARPSDQMTFFEIDPLVVRLSRDPKCFTYITDCAEGPIDTVLGDARLTLAKQPAGTVRPAADRRLLVGRRADPPADGRGDRGLSEAAEAGRGGDPAPVEPQPRHHPAGRRRRRRRWARRACTRSTTRSDAAPEMAEASTEALILSPTPERAGRLPRRRALGATGADTTVRPWTDDYVNLFGALWRQHDRSRRNGSI